MSLFNRKKTYSHIDEQDIQDKKQNRLRLNSMHFILFINVQILYVLYPHTIGQMIRTELSKHFYAVWTVCSFFAPVLPKKEPPLHVSNATVLTVEDYDFFRNFHLVSFSPFQQLLLPYHVTSLGEWIARVL